MDGLSEITPDILSCDISAASYNSSVWTDKPSFAKFKSPKVILHSDADDDDTALQRLKIDDTSALNCITERSKCTNCFR